MTEDEPDDSDADGPRMGEGFVRSSSSYRNSEKTRKIAEDVKKRSSEIRLEAERIRGLSMITLLNADMNFRIAQKAHKVALDGERLARWDRTLYSESDDLD